MNEIVILAKEFNIYRKFVENIILYNFRVPQLRGLGYSTEKIDFESVLYNKRDKTFTIKLNITTSNQLSTSTIKRERFAQFINDAFNLQEIIDKYDTSDKIVYSEELKKMNSAMFKNPNVVVICYDHNLVNRNGDESKLMSLTPKRFYLVEKVGSKYKLLTHNNYERQTENCIYINADSRSIEYKIKEWNFTKNDIFPIIGGRVEDITVELKKGAFNRGKIANTLVEFVVSEKTTCDVIDYYFRKSKELVHRQSIDRMHRNPCSEIILPMSDIIPTQPLSDPKPEVLLYYMDYFYTDNTEFDPNEFLLNHKIVIPERKVKDSKEIFDLFLNKIK